MSVYHLLSREALVLSIRSKAQSTPFPVSQRTCAPISVLSPLWFYAGLLQQCSAGALLYAPPLHGRSDQRAVIDLSVIAWMRFIAGMMFPF